MPGLAGQTSTIFNAVDLGPFRNVVRTPVRGQIAVVGRVTPLKGIDRVLRALPHVKGPWSLVVHGAGEGDEVARLARVARDLGVSDRVAFTGAFANEDEAGLLATPAVAVFPSTSEALGMALVDAMTAGVPVLASDITAHRNVLESAAPDSLVDFDQPVVAAAAVDRLLAMSTSESVELVGRLQERAQFFDIDRLVSELNDLYGVLGV
jgi:glycosyltransferase involved in cell wall biosynthesis